VSLSKQQVQHIALLARLQLAEDQFDDVVAKLSRIVDFVDQLQQVPTDDVLPMAHPLNQSQRLRPDVVTETDERETIQENAPAVSDGFYVVPKVIE
jgi:aspartyl-tRNA(Asn)/glutamyl-tRNA(Gln) amidotransferase subunit C